jgi:outer membrane receptor protein involved in Fe transport
MNFSKQVFFVVTLFLFPAFNTYSQQVIKGEVLDADHKEGLIGASIIIKGTTEGTVSDFDGSFELRTRQSFPLTIVVSYTGFEEKEVTVSNSTKVTIILAETAITITNIEVVGQRISEKQKASPLTVESLDLVAIKETAANNFYDGLGALKGVDLTAASLGFKIINTRGFNSTSPVRSLQIIDGVDNQAPGLNFSLGNFLGSSELDVLKVDVIQGASSAFYGPNAFNGVISMQTKDPFLQKGLSALIKVGERDLVEGAVRWADALHNKDKNEVLGVKLNFSFFRAHDWEAQNYNPVDGSLVPKENPGRYDAVNIYGDEYNAINDASKTALWNDVGLGLYFRTGYKEIDLVDYNTRNFKANASFHLRTNPSKLDHSSEIILSSSLGSGTTVYQGDNRFSLKNILFYQNRLEFRQRDKFFLRLYATHEDAGDSYDPYFTALLLQRNAKSDENWGQNYRRYWKETFDKKTKELGYPQLKYNPQTGNFDFNYDAATAWLQKYSDTLKVWHAIAAEFANQKDPYAAGGIETFEFFRPGTERFKSEFDRITSTKSNKKNEGTLFYDKSALYHLHGEYTFTPGFMDKIVLGGNGRLYKPDSDGTIFTDTAGIEINNYEFGIYTGGEKKFLDEKLTASFAIRVDKNENYNWISTPAGSLVWKPKPGNYLRVSFSSAIRNPTLTDQYLNLDVGRATLIGNLNGKDSLITLESFEGYRKSLIIDSIHYFNVDPVRPEKVKTFEVGYRTTLFNSIYLDAGYYYSIYNDFLGYNIGLDIKFDKNTGGILPGSRAYRIAANSTNEVTTQGVSVGLSYYFWRYYQITGNYSWNKLNKTFADDPIIPAFNTPEHKYNIGLSGRNVEWKLGNKAIRNFGFNINYKWVQGFVFEGSPQFTGFIPTYEILDAQINWSSRKLNTTFKFGASNILNKKHYQTYGGPLIGRLAYFSIQYEFKKK